MKKVLLSIMTSALLVVGCQDYDDQFSSLESQISALATTVAGLSQVQSDLASLAGTVSSLASTVNGLGDTIDTAVSDGLTDIQADIDAIETAVADVASSEEVSSLADAVDAAQDDLTDLLATSSVFTGKVTINNQSTLDAFYNMGVGLAIVNGSVDIDVSATMDIAKVQAVVDNILTTTGDYAYNVASTDIGKVTFNKLSGTQSLTVQQAGAYMFKGLVSAGNIVLMDTYKTKVDTIHLGALTTVTSLSDGVVGQLDFSAAEELHLTSLTYYAGGDLTLKTKRDGVLAIGALTDTNASAVVTPMTLTVDGPASLTFTGIKGDSYGASKGAITLSNVATANISNFGGTITLGTGVDNATLEDVAVSPVITAADDLVTLSIEGVTAYGKSYTTAGTANQAKTLYTSAFIDVALTTTQGSLTDVTISGKVDSFTSTNADNISKMTLDGLTANVVNITGADEMTSLTTGASKINDFTLNDNDDLTSVALDFDVYTTVGAATGFTADASGDVDITGNKKLASLTVHVKSANDIDIDTNDALAEINFPFLATIGGTNPDIDIFDNALVATSVTDNYDATSAGVAITTNGATNTGSYATTSKIGTLTAWIDLAIAAAGTSTLQVWFDTVSEVKTSDVNGTVTTTNPGEVDGSTYHVVGNAGTTYAAVYIVPGVTKVSTMDGAVAGETRTWVFDLKRDVLGSVLDLGTGEGFVLNHGAGSTVTFAHDATLRTTVTSLVDYMNADTSLAAANLNIDAALDSAERYVYTVTYLTSTNSVNSVGVASVTGAVYATFGTGNDGALIELSAPLTAGLTNADNFIAEGFRADIAAHADYNATSITTGANALRSFYVTRNVSGTATVDKSPLMAAAPTLDIAIDAAMASTTAVLGANTAGYRTVSHLSNTYSASRYSLPDVAPVLQSNLRITLRDTSGLGMAAAVTLTAANKANSNTAITVGTVGIGTNQADAESLTAFLLADGVSIASATSNVSSGTTDATATTYYVAAAAAGGTEAVSTAAVTAVTTDRTGWLPTS